MDMDECMSDSATRIRLTLTLTKVYVDALDWLVEEGLYMEHQVAIRDALRHLFKFHGIDPFSEKAESAAPSEP